MQKRYRHILPVPNSPGTAAAGGSAQAEPTKRKRSSTVMACNSCRAKKSACDGVRPACAACAARGKTCTYMSAIPETPSMLKKRELEALREDHTRLSGLINVLRTVPEGWALDILRKLRRTTADLAALLPSDRNRPFVEALPRQVLARLPTQGGLEFELMIRHPVAYPTLAPLDAAGVGATSLLTCAVASTLADELSSDLAATASLSTSGPHQRSARGQGQGQRSAPASRTILCDTRLELLDISSWSQVVVTSERAAAVISLYLETDHPTLGFFDADLFLADLVSIRIRYCSPLLVSAVLSWACLAYCTFNPEAAQLGEAFFAEADDLWQLDQASDSLPTVAAAQLLGLVAIYKGRDAGNPYYSLGTQMAKRMGLFGLPDSALFARSPIHGKESDTLARARSHTAWGVFNWVIMRSLLFQVEEPAAKYPPSAHPPGEPTPFRLAHFTASTTESAPLPSYMGQTFPNMCDFWRLTSEWTTVYYVSGNAPILGRVSLGYAHETFRKLLAWSAGIDTMLARGDKSSHHCIILHIWFHTSILQLFRPFMQQLKPLVKPPHTAPDAFPTTVFAASLNQLKHLALVFRYTFACAMYAAFWHVALMYIANAVIQDTEDPQWRGYLMLCLDGYGDLFGAFPVAGAIAKSLLSMALRLSVVTSSEARVLMAGIYEKGAHHPSTEQISASFVVDLDLAVTDRAAAELANLNNSFDDLVMFQEFTQLEPNTGADRNPQH
ncbi:fungal zn(2)-Cys(6) binuclear cluster domain-containing protein [Hirsutella rhossiliensis]|uniref:Fungal zn(2)-Cys(6) binuclear cluster domain-containing protein n=1 Tax=Hirsutella rhossiliensis TaxID=111463 RepID=A0A9P8MJT2_9HYPO|nr:fungal zn(2)-Cys(6) binuclear cluster domain-containing protein [Hirsutella rhossiliensis]KAH0957643.1 fungal zn(2)-Cys(6) binuclear cluster domain-containing protein [Hirsutella rhossiliensis]